jgi:TolA-binding protein
MKISRRLRIAASIAALALAVSAAAPILQAQTPPPAPPPTSGDGKAFAALLELVQQEKWNEAMKAGEKFLEQYKELSPNSRNVHYLLALAYLHQEKMQDDAIRELKKLLPDKNVTPDVKEQALMLIAKAHTMKGIGMDSDTAPQRKVRDDIFNEAIKGYDAYLAAYPQSKSGDSAYFLSGVLSLEVKRFEDAVKRFGTVFQRYPQSPLKSDALLNIGKTFLIQANDLMTAAPGKEPKPEDIEKALELYGKNALPALTSVFRESADLAILNEAQYYIGQIRLTQSQHVNNPDEDKKKQELDALLNPALDAFRAVRSIEEVIAAQDAKIKALQEAIARLQPGTAEYLPYKSYYENLIGVESDKKDKLKTGTDQYLAARVAIARIFLFLKRYDECRVLIRYLQGQKELFAKDKDSEAAIYALLCHTYVGQTQLILKAGKKADSQEFKQLAAKAIEAYDAFRAAFKGNEAGEDLPLFIANMVLEQADGGPKAEEIINQGMEDYKNAHGGGGNAQGGGGWQYANDAVRVLISVAMKKGDYQKALDLCEKVLAGTPKPDVEMETLYSKGTIQEEMALDKRQPALMDQAIATFQLVRDKFPTHGRAEDAWFRQCQILAGKDGPKAIAEILKFIEAYGGGSGKSDNAKANLSTNHYTLGKVYANIGQADKAIEAYRKLIDKFPESDAAQDAYFRLQDIEKERKNEVARMKIMEEFLQKYPKHKNVYYAFYNIADVLGSGALNAKPDPTGKGPATTPAPTIADVEKCVKKFIEYVDYEKAQQLPEPHGESALINAESRWESLVAKSSFDLLPNDQKLNSQRALDGVLAVVEKYLQSFPDGERVGEILERAANIYVRAVLTRQSDVAKGEAYFRDLATKFGDTKPRKAKLVSALAAFLNDSDPKRAATVRREIRDLVPEPIMVPVSPGSKEMKIGPSLTPGEWDRHLADLFAEKKYDDMGRMIARVRSEYPLDEKAEPTAAPPMIQNGQATALFWEAKILQEQGKAAAAGPKMQELITKYPKTTKRAEADYGVINGNFESGALKGNTKAQRAAIKRLSEIFGKTDVKDFTLNAKALYLAGQIYEDMADYDSAIAAFAKVAQFPLVPKLPGDGLWKAATLLERQAAGQLPVKLPAEKAAMAAKIAKEEAEEKKAEEAKKAAEDAKNAKPGEAKPGDKKPGEAKPADAKPDDKKPAAPKAGDKKTANAGAQK